MPPPPVLPSALLVVQYKAHACLVGPCTKLSITPLTTILQEGVCPQPSACSTQDCVTLTEFGQTPSSSIKVSSRLEVWIALHTAVCASPVCRLA